MHLRATTRTGAFVRWLLVGLVYVLVVMALASVVPERSLIGFMITVIVIGTVLGTFVKRAVEPHPTTDG